MVTVFWAFGIFDRRHLLYPEVDNLIHPFVDQLVHTVVLFFVLVELICQQPKSTMKPNAIFISNVCFFAYYLCLMSAAWLNGLFFYPIFNYFNDVQHVVVTAIMGGWWNLILYFAIKLSKIENRMGIKIKAW